MKHLPIVTALTLLCQSGPGVAAADHDPNLGRNLAAICVNCHNTNPHDTSAIEPLVGMPRAKIVKKMHAFRSDEKTATLMNQLAKGFNDAQIEIIATYLASQGRAK
ncbi:MAG: cytochrome C [Rugosibacter sp.]|nr:cytochrome C [Rugosibacter sp.]